MTSPPHIQRIDRDDLTVLDGLPPDLYTGHVQGIAVRSGSLFMSSVDTRQTRGLIFKLALPALSMEASTVLFRQPNMYHPGGITFLGEELLVPLAAYAGSGPSILMGLDPDTLEAGWERRVEEHVGAVGWTGEDVIISATWDAAELLLFDREGNPASRLENPTDIAYQDMEFADGRLYCSGVRRSERSQGRVDVYEVQNPPPGEISLRLQSGISVPPIGESISLAREGMTLLNGKFAFLPEDDPDTRVYVTRQDVEELVP